MKRRTTGAESAPTSEADSTPSSDQISATGSSVELRLASLLSIATDAIILLDREQRILLFNEGAERIFGWKKEEVIGKAIDILLPESFREIHRRHVDEFAASPVAARRMGERREIFGLRKGGEEFPAEASIAKAGRGAETTLTVVLRDATARKRVEQELRRRERQLEEAQAIAHLGSWEWDVIEGTIRWSDEMYRVYGLEPGSVEVSFEGFLARVHPEDRDRVRDIVESACERAESFSFPHRIVRPGGSVRLLHARGESVTDADGRVVRMIGTGQDVTGRAKAERKARRLAGERAARAEAETTARRMEFLAEAGRILSSSLDYEATLAEVARLAVPFLAEYCAVFVEDEEGEPLQRVGSAHSRPEYADQIVRVEETYLPDPDNPHSLVGQVFRTGEPRLLPEFSPEALERAMEGQAEALEIVRKLAPRSAMMVPLATRGRRLGVIAFYRSDSAPRYGDTDLVVAERLAAKAALALDNARLFEAERRARTEAEEATALRDEVLAIVSHDLRSPLHAIAICGELLSQEPSEADRKAHIQILERSVGRMARLVEDLLDVGRIESGRFSVRPEPSDPREVVERALEEAGPAATEKGVRLLRGVIDCPSPVPMDRRRIEQVLSNLLENAIRHTPAEGRIEVSAVGRGERLVCSVVDTGEGIPEPRRRELFDHIWHAREGGRDRAGLGLTIARGIVEAHGGRIWVESEPGQGAAFHFAIPAAAERLGGAAAGGGT